jgi:hypothetical protein
MDRQLGDPIYSFNDKIVIKFLVASVLSSPFHNYFGDLRWGRDRVLSSN